MTDKSLEVIHTVEGLVDKCGDDSYFMKENSCSQRSE